MSCNKAAYYTDCPAGDLGRERPGFQHAVDVAQNNSWSYIGLYILETTP